MIASSHGVTLKINKIIHTELNSVPGMWKALSKCQILWLGLSYKHRPEQDFKGHNNKNNQHFRQGKTERK